MRKEIKSQWISALRSGQFPQAQGTLNRVFSLTHKETPGYCCLGVLSELACNAEIVTKEIQSTGVAEYTDVNRSGYPVNEQGSAYLTDGIRDWADLDSAVGEYLTWVQVYPFLSEAEKSLPALERTTDNLYNFATLNDAGVSFETIAKLIEVYL
jgi:hypothetical protein